jgi:probable F420-dependent oxidoreductase
MSAATLFRFSVGLPQNLSGDDARPVAAYARRAEALGFEGLWTLDSALGGPTAHTPLLDGLQVLSHVAAVTERARLGVAVIVMGRRQPALLARELATIDRLSGGRLVVGVGLGAPEGERVAALGFPTDRRVRRLTEGVAVMRALWASDAAAHDGELWHFTGARVEPKPVQRPGPPVWFGAGREPALRRAARIGDGWIGSGSSSVEDFAAQAAVVRSALEEEGRDPARFAIAKRVYVAVEDDEAVARRRLGAVIDGMYGASGLGERVAVGGPPERVAEALRALVAAGAQELALTPMYGHLAQLEALAEVVRLAR